MGFENLVLHYLVNFVYIDDHLTLGIGDPPQVPKSDRIARTPTTGSLSVALIKIHPQDGRLSPLKVEMKATIIVNNVNFMTAQVILIIEA